MRCIETCSCRADRIPPLTLEAAAWDSVRIESMWHLDRWCWRTLSFRKRRHGISNQTILLVVWLCLRQREHTMPGPSWSSTTLIHVNLSLWLLGYIMYSTGQINRAACPFWAIVTETLLCPSFGQQPSSPGSQLDTSLVSLPFSSSVTAEISHTPWWFFCRWVVLSWGHSWQTGKRTCDGKYCEFPKYVEWCT